MVFTGEMKAEERWQGEIFGKDTYTILIGIQEEEKRMITGQRLDEPHFIEFSLRL